TPAPGTAAPAHGVVAPAAPVLETREEAIAGEKRVRIDTPRLHGSIALNGGRIDDLTLATYHDTVDPKSPEVVLLWPTATKDSYFADFVWGAETAGVKVTVPEGTWTPARWRRTH